ncbi:MAG: hypothetical protein Q7J82_04170 [Coriobacteriia bacterium]|nr:hypothetical protein [Coriobacteriia bacterium]
MGVHAQKGMRAWMVITLAVLLLALLLGGQALSDHVVPEASGGATVDAVGRAGFAYLSGFRTYIAAVLWNRLHPVMHLYYSGVGFRDMRYMVSTIGAVVMLDPQLIEPYYVGAWIVAANDQVAEGIALARKGTEANPRSGLLRVNYAEILEVWGNDLAAAHEQAAIAMDPDMEWRDGFEKHDSYAVIGSIMRLFGDEERVALVDAEIERINVELGDSLPPDPHDHDGDGVPDH